ncbi:hypothetical protein M413DRAFT_282704 [Hebeloma cylindrosporum]|uniref:Oxidoreductase molybdopterin-binding domain-containing protein n=1 Tax=Hebeloma cylindrosporum TaxID=76867 RepID=A0A0C3BZT7_HEBCY|nr:hypothetical protein M413DRAFT_282704 [Hebeloma cylindrosporum h7]
MDPSRSPNGSPNRKTPIQRRSKSSRLIRPRIHHPQQPLLRSQPWRRTHHKPGQGRRMDIEAPRVSRNLSMPSLFPLFLLSNTYEHSFHDTYLLRLCSNPTTLSLADLRTMFRVVTVPVTLVCAGNRRKEQNVVQKSLGFSWGPGGISTALFTGVYLADVLDFVQPARQAKHVVFEGSDDLPNGPYGTR